MRTQIFLTLFAILAITFGLGFVLPWLWALSALMVPLILVGVHDCMQVRHAVLKNFPVIGHFRYMLEMIRPEINQYFIESDMDGTPFNRELRSVVYQRAKTQLDTVPFGTQLDVYKVGYEWIAHSMNAVPWNHEEQRVLIGEHTCEKPYSCSLLNVSAMSYGSLSSNAIRALNGGAKKGGFYHNTGEGGISPHHLEPGGDLVWQVGTGYFGCRNDDGTFNAEEFAENAQRPEVRMIEIKLSQGAKPGHGGILPAVKVTQEVADIRGVPIGVTVLSPPSHSAFTTPLEMLDFIVELRELSGGKPVGIKLCVGCPTEFMALCKAMYRTQRFPDFIAVDGGEGGTGAAPLEFTNSVGMPLTEALIYVHNCLVGFKLRDRVRIGASGKIVTGFHMIKRLAIGADFCISARAMMLALGCIQARRCNSNECPVGVATQVPGLVQGLDVVDKTTRVYNYHYGTIEGFHELLGAAGVQRAADLLPSHVMRRVSDNKIASFEQIYSFMEEGALLTDPVPQEFESFWNAAKAEAF